MKNFLELLPGITSRPATAAGIITISAEIDGQSPLNKRNNPGSSSAMSLVALSVTGF